MRALKTFICASLASAAGSLAFADIYNGDFEAGGEGWTVSALTEWTVEFPADGGNPDGHVLFRAERYVAGEACISQIVDCGIEGEGTCSVALQFETWQEFRPAEPLSREGAVRVYVDGELIFDHMDDGLLGWRDASLDIPCGIHELGFCFEIDDDPDIWVAAYDNVTATCDEQIPITSQRWSNLKVRFR